MSDLMLTQLFEAAKNNKKRVTLLDNYHTNRNSLHLSGVGFRHAILRYTTSSSAMLFFYGAMSEFRSLSLSLSLSLSVSERNWSGTSFSILKSLFAAALSSGPFFSLLLSSQSATSREKFAMWQGVPASRKGTRLLQSSRHYTCRHSNQ